MNSAADIEASNGDHKAPAEYGGEFDPMSYAHEADKAKKRAAREVGNVY
jgi:hypothetical protein